MFSCFVVYFVITKQHHSCVSRSCRLTRNTGWWENAWHNYSEARIRKTFRISQSTFRYILLFRYCSDTYHIGPFLARETVTEHPISTELRLVLCLYRLGREDHLYAFSEMAGVGISMVCSIVNEVCQVLVDHLWSECVSSQMRKTQDDFKKKMLDMDEFWQFPCCWAGTKLIK